MHLHDPDPDRYLEQSMKNSTVCVALLRGVAASLFYAGILSTTLSAAWGDTLPAQSRKVALIIGNSGYDGGDRLVSPANDAHLMDQSFKKLGFETHLEYDVTQQEFKDGIQWLAEHAQGADVAVLYYAGHGFEVGGDNFLVPVHAGVAINAMNRLTLLQKGIRLQGALTQIRASRPNAFIAIIDACREPSRGASQQSLKPETRANGELIAFSASPNQGAFDSMQTFGQKIDNSPFAYYFSMNMLSPGATILDALRYTQQQVVRITQDQQRPWINSGLVGDVVLAKQDGNTAPVQVGAIRSGATLASRGAHNTAPTQGLGERTGLQAGMSASVTDSAAAAQRAASWDDAERDITVAAQQGDADTANALRARKNDPSALTTLGLMSEQGSGMPRNPRAALTYYRRAAEQGFPVAQTLLGEAYYEGKLIPRNTSEAEQWIAKAAAQNYTRARLDLSQIRIERGQGPVQGNLLDIANAMTAAIRQSTASSGFPASPQR